MENGKWQLLQIDPRKQIKVENYRNSKKLEKMQDCKTEHLSQTWFSLNHNWLKFSMCEFNSRITSSQSLGVPAKSQDIKLQVDNEQQPK